MPPARYLVLSAIAALAGIFAIHALRPIVDTSSLETNKPHARGAPAGQTDLASLAKGEMAAFDVKTPPTEVPEFGFKDENGNDLTLKDFRGKVVLLNLWATWCAPCLVEMPTLDQLQQELGSKNFEVVALSLDIRGAPTAKKMLTKLKVKNLKLYVDQTSKAGRHLGVRGMPTTILIDPQGREIGRLAGPANWESPDTKRLIKAVLPSTN